MTTTNLIAQTDAVISCWNKYAVNCTDYNHARLCDSVCDLSVALSDGIATVHALKAFDACERLYDRLSAGFTDLSTQDILRAIVFHVKSI